MTTRTKIIIAVIALAAAYGFGRWSTPVRVETKTVTVEVKKKETDTDRDKNTHMTVVEVTKPDGTKEKTTTVDTSTKTDTKTVDDTNKSSDTEKVVTYNSPKVTILGTYGLPLGGGIPVYGGEINRQILGPITIGVTGNSSGVIGLALGLTL